MNLLGLLPPYAYYLVAGLQLVCILHALKTGRRDWLYLLIFLPGIGGIIYFIREIMPGMRTDTIGRDMANTFIPGSRIKELERALRIADTDANRLALAAEYARQRQYPRAIELVRECMTGIYANDPGMMLELARLLFHNGQFADSVTYFSRVLPLKGNRFDKPEDELLYARALDCAGNLELAEEEYKKVIRIHHSMEARFFYGLMLKRLNRGSEAATQFQTIQDEKDLHPPHIRRLNAEWIQRSKRELSAR